MWAPLGSEPPQFGYEQCVEWISESLAPLGDEYVATVRRGVHGAALGGSPTRTRVSRQGAFSFGTPGTHPFIMMSFQGGRSRA